MLSVGIATFRRGGLTATIASLGEGARRPDRVIVADNDDAPSAEGRARAACAAAGLALTYRHAPARNISVARNAVLAAAGTDRLAWIDDDETAPPGWLAAMEEALAAGQASGPSGRLAAVFGPGLADYPEDAPPWMLRLRPHDQRVPVTGGRVIYGHTANALCDLRHPAFAGLRFDEALGRTGGEDQDYFARAHARGGRYALADAPVREAVPPGRLDPDWLLARRRRAGATYAATRPGRAAAMALAVPKLLWCAGGAATRRGDARWKARLRGAFHAGGIAFGLGVRPREHYGTEGTAAKGPEPSQPAPDRSQ